MAATALLAAGLGLCLVLLCFVFLTLLPHIEANLPQAQRTARRVYLTSAALALVLTYISSVPYITTILSLSLSTSLVLSVKMSSPSHTSSPPSSLYLLLFSHLLLPMVTHHSLLSHLSHHSFRSHAVHTAPRLPGGRVSWDVPDEDVTSVVAGALRARSLAETVMLFVVLVWGQTFCAWVLYVATVGRRPSWGLPLVSVGQKRQQGEHKAR